LPQKPREEILAEMASQKERRARIRELEAGLRPAKESALVSGSSEGVYKSSMSLFDSATPSEPIPNEKPDRLVDWDDAKSIAIFEQERDGSR
jgi:hypothetical protein